LKIITQWDNSKTRVCIVNDDFNLGGVQRVAIEIAEGLSQLSEMAVSLYNFQGDGTFFYKVSSNIDVYSNQFQYTKLEKIWFRIGMTRYKLLGTELKITRHYNRAIEKFSTLMNKQNFDCVILCQGYFTAIIPILKKKFPKTKFIGWQHSSFDVYMEKYNAFFKQEYIQGLKKADRIVCLTKQDMESFKKYNPNTTFIYNPLTLNTDKISNLKNNSVIFTGRLALQPKGLDYFIQLAELSPPDWHFRVAGDGPDNEKIENIVSEKNLESKIHFAGPLTGDELLAHYLGGDVFVSTSRWEGFGLVLTEAMKCGLPVVAFDNHGPREILADGKYGILVEKFNVEKMHEEITKLMNDDQLKMTYQKKSLERVAAFSLDTIIEEWRRIILNNK